MKLAVYNQKGEKTKEITTPAAFDSEISDSALSQYINYLRNSMRDPIANTKDRSQVSGGGKKPWKQKGTGRARHGSSRSPLWVGGGVTFGPSSEQNFKQRINKSLKRKAILSIMSTAMKDKKAIVVENLELPEIKTSSAVTILENVKAEGKISLIYTQTEGNTQLSFRNLAGVTLSTPEKLNIIDIMSANNIVISEQSLTRIAEIYSK